MLGGSAGPKRSARRVRARDRLGQALPIMRLLRPSPRRSGAIRICSAQSAVGFRSSLREARFDDGVEASVGKTRSLSVPLTREPLIPPPTTSSRSSSQA